MNIRCVILSIMMRKIAHIVLIAALILSVALPATAAQNRAIRLTLKDMAQERRIALVVGNSTYRNGPLRNPSNDAQDVANALKSARFDVKLLLNADKRTMRKAVDVFGRR